MGNRSLKTKLVLSFALVATFLLVVGGVSYYSLNAVVTKFDEITDNNLPKTAALGELRVNAMGVARNLTFLAQPSISHELFKAYEEKLENRLAQFEKAEKDYSAMPFEAGEEQLFTDMISKWKIVRAEGDVINILLKEEKPASDAKAVEILSSSFDEKYNIFTDSIRALAKFEADDSKELQKEAKKIENESEYFEVGVVIAGFIAAFGLGIFTSGNLSRKLSELSRQLGDGANEVGAASHELSNSSTELSSSATEQAASLQETTASAEEISAMVVKNSENAARSKEISSQSRQVADEGKKIITQMLEATQAIAESNDLIMKQVDESNREIVSINIVIGEIANKTKVINDIVFQTKLLSFNASVEAARAGEHGKGFAVVAEEVGNLAQMSGNAAKEISALLETSTQKVQQIVDTSAKKVSVLISSGKQKVDLGKQIAERCETVFNEIMTNITQVDQMVGEISEASREQSQGISEITKAMNQLDQATQQNASISHQAASASNELASQSESLRNLVGNLNQLISGKADLAPVVAHRKEAPSAKVLPLEFKNKKQPAKASFQTKIVVGDKTPGWSDSGFQDV